MPDLDALRSDLAKAREEYRRLSLGRPNPEALLVSRNKTFALAERVRDATGAWPYLVPLPWR